MIEKCLAGAYCPPPQYPQLRKSVELMSIGRKGEQGSSTLYSKNFPLRMGFVPLTPEGRAF